VRAEDRERIAMAPANQGANRSFDRVRVAHSHDVDLSELC